MTTEGKKKYESAWSRVQERLAAGLPSWRERIDGWGQLAAVEARESGRRWSDDEVFQGIVLSVLSNNTNWERVERVRPELERRARDGGMRLVIELGAVGEQRRVTDDELHIDVNGDDARTIWRHPRFERGRGRKDVRVLEEIMAEQRAKLAIGEGDQEEFSGAVTDRSIVEAFADVDRRPAPGREDDALAILEFCFDAWHC